MNKIKEKWSKFTKSQKILTILLGICIVTVIAVNCGGPSSNESNDNKSNIKQEEQVTEPEIKDEYVSPKKSDIESLNSIILSLFRENFTYDSFDVSVDTIGDTVNIKILSYDLDTSLLSKSQIDYALCEANIPSVYNNLADTTEEVYYKAGYNVKVKIKLYDSNGILLYTAES